MEDCWEDLVDVVGEGSVIPITYMNSTAKIKALCGRNGGIVCTSSNATRIFKWAFERGSKILFLPDQHLGRNTALRMGLTEDDMVLWSPFNPMGGQTKESLDRAKVILWEGHCSVHTRFTVKQIEEAREADPSVNILVHPECTREVVDAADYNGSTEYIVKMVTEAPAGTSWGIGTEINLVKRLATEYPDKKIFCLDPIVCPCATMYRIHPAYLLWVLEGLMANIVINQVSVPGDVARDARTALQRMLDVTG